MKNPEKKQQNRILLLKPLFTIILLAGISTGTFVVISRNWMNELFRQVEIQRQQNLSQIVMIARNSVEPEITNLRSGRISRIQAMNRVRAILRSMKYKDQYGDNYIFMSSYDGTMLVQPFEPLKEMTNQWDLRDTHGLYIIRELVRAARTHPEGSFVRYYYYLPGVHEPQEKLAFVTGLPELQCYIGTGMYMQSSIQEQKKILTKVRYSSILFLITILIPASVSILIILNRNRRLLSEIESRERAEEELKKSEAKYRSIFENVMEGIFQTSADGRLISVNPALARIFGYSSPQEMIDNTTDIGTQYYADPSDRIRYIDAINKNGFVENFSARFKRRDGHLIWASNNSRVIRDNDGNVMYYEGTIEDITERIEAEENLKNSRKLLSDILQAASEFSIIATDPEGTITLFNNGSERMLGYSTEEMVGKQNPIILHLPSEIETRSRELTSELGYPVEGFRVFVTCAELKGSETREWTYVRKDGSTLSVSLVITAMCSECDEITGYLGIANDITERKQAEAMSRQSEEKFQKIFLTSPEGIAITRIEDGELLDVNPGFEALTGWKKEEIIGRTSLDIKFWVDPAERGRMLDELQQGKNIRYHNLQFRRKDGECRPGIYSARTILLAGKPCLVFVMRDITEQRRMEEERKKLEQQLYQSQKMDAIGKLAGGVAHDFNNILTGIQGNVSLLMLKLNPDDPDYRRLGRIEEQVKRGANLTRQLLDLARGGKNEVSIISVNELIRKSAQLFIETRKGIEVNFIMQDDMYPVEADTGQIEQVLLNLFINAGHAMPDGGSLTIQTSNITLHETDVRAFQVSPGDYVKISVTDTGIGMDRDTIRRIFEPFFTTKSEQGGTGLGLASAYGIIHNHGGSINAYSEPGKGSTFNIYLPSSSKKVEDEKHESSGTILSGTGGILLVDDEPLILESAAEMLKTLGYTVYKAASGYEALNIFRDKQGEINLIILDMIMPVMNGSQTLRMLKQVDPGIRIILSSGNIMPGEEFKAVESVCWRFMQKPYNIKTLSDTVYQAIYT